MSMDYFFNLWWFLKEGGINSLEMKNEVIFLTLFLFVFKSASCYVALAGLELCKPKQVLNSWQSSCFWLLHARIHLACQQHLFLQHEWILRTWIIFPHPRLSTHMVPSPHSTLIFSLPRTLASAFIITSERTKQDSTLNVSILTALPK